MLAAGTLNRRVRIEKRGPAQDETGQPIDDWVELATVWGGVLMVTGKESALAGAEVGSATASIRIRYRTDITNGMRAIVGGVIYNILQPLPNVSSREWTDLACSTGANNG